MINGAMAHLLLSAPLVRWDDLHVVLDIPAIERLLKRRLQDIELVSDLKLDGRDDRLSLGLRVHWKGVSIRAWVELQEIRLRHRRLGFRLGRLRALGGLPVPKIAVLRTLQNAVPELVTVVKGTDIVVVDLRNWIPPEVSLRVVAIQVVNEGLHVWLASGSVNDFPQPQHEQLPPGNPEKSLPSGS